MYLKRVDTDEPTEFDGYSYLNKDGEEEFVVMKCEGYVDKYVSFTDSNGDSVVVYKSDVPKLIKALEAAYNHKEI